MLSEEEKEGCLQLLNKLSTSELFSLADTVTKKQINVARKSEAVKAILDYTTSPVELMRRRKMKRDVLFQYLVDCNVVVSVSADKKDLIQRILKHWGAPAVDLSEMDVDMDVEMSAEDLTTGPGPATSTVTQGAQTTTGQFSPAGVQTDNPVPQSQSIAAHLPQNGSQIVQNPINTGQLCNQQSLGSSNITVQISGILNARPETDSDLQALGEQFSKWFYQMLNSFNPTTQDTPGDFGPHHFWDDATLKVTAVTSETSHEEHHGPKVVAERLISYTKDEQLLFNPNIGREGVFVKSSRHGLVMIMVCGTIHRSNNCLGVFQQVFGIIKDPRFHDNWKIKMSNLDVKSSQVTAMPKLEGNVDSIVNSLVPV